MSSPGMEHIERLRPPWRHIRLTECGREVAEFAEVLSREQIIAKVKEQGQQRAALSTCMNCFNRVQVWQRKEHWADDPSAHVSRDAGRREDLLAAELRALAVLYEAHADEYAEIVTGMAATVDLGAARNAKSDARKWREGSRKR